MGNEELRNLITTVKLGAFPSPSFHETIGLKEQTHTYCFPLGKPFKYLVLVRVINQKKYFLNTPDWPVKLEIDYLPITSQVFA